MGNFFAELKRRHIYRVGAAYVVVAWALTQLVEIMEQIFSLPLWIAQSAIVLLALGFPIALFVAWTIESKPHEAVAAAVRSKPTIVDWTLCGALALVLVFMGYQQLVPSSFSTATRQVGVNAAKDAAASTATAVSIAVLPFTNLSSDPEQEFFSDGITEEITSALAKVPDLRVVARTSAFQFKGQNRDIQSIAQQLHATHVIEGSVRTAGGRVRITAQLINAHDGTHLWTENYDRELRDIFAIQEDISRTIATSLRMPLGLSPGENLINNRNIDPEAHRQFLRALAMVNSRRPENLLQSTALLEQILAPNPEYAPAWALLATAYFLIGNSRVAADTGSVDELRSIAGDILSKADAAARRAITLDPGLPVAYATSGVVLWAQLKPREGDELFLKGLALDPNDWGTLESRAIRLSISGNVKAGITINEHVRSLEPFLPQPAIDQVFYLWVAGRNDEAIALAQSLPTGATHLARIYASMGRYSEAAEALMGIRPNDPIFAAAREAAQLLRMAPAKLSVRELPRLPAALDHVYLHVGAPERVMDNLERRVAVGYMAGNAATHSIWHTSYALVRKTERFKAYVRAAGFVDFWRASGWPDLCRPMGADDFECD